MFKAVLFDLDGVLVDSRSVHVASYVSFLKGRGVSVSSEEIEKRFGVLDVVVFRDIINKKKLKGSASKWSEERGKLLFGFLKNVKSFAGVKGFLKKLKGRYFIGLATSSRRREAVFVLKNLKLFDFFDVVLGRECVKKHKPDPEIYLKLAKKLNVKLKECVVFEDSVAGVNAAKRAGMFCVAVLNSYPKKLLPADLHVRRLDDKKLVRLLDL